MTLLSIKQIAELFGMHQMTIYKLIWNKELPAIKIGNRWRVHLEDIEKFVSRKE